MKEKEKTKTYCIVCGKEKNGIEIMNDRVIECVRWFKKNVTHNENNNRLVVCKECYDKYKSAKKKFNSRKKIYLVLGIIFGFLIIITARSVASFGFAIFIVILLYLFSFFSYVPDLSLDAQAKTAV